MEDKWSSFDSELLPLVSVKEQQDQDQDQEDVVGGTVLSGCTDGILIACVERLTQCSGLTRTGNRCCRRRWCKDSDWYCYQHVKQSNA